MVSNVPTSKRGQYQFFLPLYLGWVYCPNVVVGEKKGQGIGRDGSNNKDRRMRFKSILRS